jgi:sarcosine oxidase, subunit beta
VKLVSSSSPSVIVVGGGILGAATLYELARRGVPTVLFERGCVAGGSTGRSAGIVRMHYSNPDVVRMAVRSRNALGSIHEVAGCKPVYVPAGWLFLIDTEQVAQARRNREMQLAEGAESIELRPSELQDVAPGISLDGIGCAIFEERSGYADPIAATHAYLTAAQREGGVYHEHSPVDRLVESGGRVQGVFVAGAVIPCESVVLAAGPWSSRLAAGVSVRLPMKVTREQDVIYATGSAKPTPVSISDQVDRIYLRPLTEAGTKLQLVGRGFPKEYEYVSPDYFATDVDRPFEAEVKLRLRRRFPALGPARLFDSRVGLYDVPPDWHPLLGPVEGIAGLQLATGGSGHCFKLGPAIGELIAAAIVGETVEWARIERFSMHRFDRGAPIPSTFGGNRA